MADEAGNASVVARSICTIAFYALIGPLFGAALVLSIREYPSVPNMLQAAAFAFVGAPLVAMVAYPAGLIPALMTGCLCAMVSPVMARSDRYVLASVAIGIATTGLFASVLVGRRDMFWLMIGAGAFAALCCGIISNLFRARPAAQVSVS